MLHELKQLQVDRNGLDELLELWIFAVQLHNSYKAFELQIPDWLTEAQRLLDTEIKIRRRNALAKRVKEEALKTPTEKRKGRA